MATATLSPPRVRAEPSGRSDRTTGGRVPGLDRLRAAALLLMLVHHLTDWLVGTKQVLPGWDGFVLTDAAAPAFVVAAGASLHLLVRSRRRRGVPRVWLHGLVLRRYGLLIPIGVLLRIAVWGHVEGFQVLECLGVAVLAAYLVGRVVPGRALPVAAVAVLAAAPLVEGAAASAHGFLAEDVLAGRFPVVLYTGLALAGYAGARLLGGHDRPAPALALGGALAVVAGVLIAFGHEPRRYPGGFDFIVPGLALTLLLYGGLAAWRPSEGSRIDAVLRSAGTHTLGIFLAHYVVYVLLDRAGWMGTVPTGLGIVLAVAIAVGFALVAPRVPTLPWSPRTGWRRRRRLSRAGS